jgi:hypothetical protein
VWIAFQYRVAGRCCGRLSHPLLAGRAQIGRKKVFAKKVAGIDSLIQQLSTTEGLNSQDFYKFAATVGSLRVRICRLRKAGYVIYKSEIPGTGTGARYVNYRI